mgnify:FL=1
MLCALMSCRIHKMFCHFLLQPCNPVYVFTFLHVPEIAHNLSFLHILVAHHFIMIIAADEDTFDACKSYDWLLSVQTSEEARRALLQIPLLLRSLL